MITTPPPKIAVNKKIDEGRGEGVDVGGQSSHLFFKIF